jgi:hypothetical protein
MRKPESLPATVGKQDKGMARLLAGDAINTVLCRYATAIDRCDLALLKSVYWENATDDHGIFKGNAHEFADFIIPWLAAYEHTMHRITNVTFVLSEEGAADVHSYFMAYHEHGNVQVVVGGRYVDRFEKRGEEWRIAARTVMMDWNQNLKSTADWSEGPTYASLPHGRKAPHDLIYSRPLLYGR